MAEIAARVKDDTAHALKEIFWRQGYENASIEDIVQATGVNRYTLYNTYGGKHELFLAALDAYYYERKGVFFDSISDLGAPPMDAVKRVFNFAIDEMVARGNGCLICNVATDVAPTNETVRIRINAYIEEIRSSFLEALSRAQDRNELRAHVTPSDASDLLITTMLGLGVRAKLGASGEDMSAHLDGVLASIARESAT